MSLTLVSPTSRGSVVTLEGTALQKIEIDNEVLSIVRQLTSFLVSSPLVESVSFFIGLLFIRGFIELRLALGLTLPEENLMDI